MDLNYAEAVRAKAEASRASFPTDRKWRLAKSEVRRDLSLLSRNLPDLIALAAAVAAAKAGPNWAAGMSGLKSPYSDNIEAALAALNS